MIKQRIKPENGSITINIPDNYKGKELEVLIYSDDDVSLETKLKSKKKFNPEEAWGILSKEEAEKYRQHLKEVRDSWDRDIR